MKNLIINLIHRGFQPIYLGGDPLFYFIIRKDNRIKELLEKYSRIYKTISVSGNGFGTGIQIMIK